MGESQTEQVLRNLDRRVAGIEQFLPSVATKADLREAIADAIAPLATRAELQAAIAPLATREELREVSETLRRHMDIVAESIHDTVRILAENILRLNEDHHRLDGKFGHRCDGLDDRVTRLEAGRRRKT